MRDGHSEGEQFLLALKEDCFWSFERGIRVFRGFDLKFRGRFHDATSAGVWGAVSDMLDGATIGGVALFTCIHGCWERVSKSIAAPGAVAEVCGASIDRQAGHVRPIRCSQQE